MGCSGGTTNSRHTTRASYPENFGTVTIEPNLPHGNNKIRNRFPNQVKKPQKNEHYEEE